MPWAPLALRAFCALTAASSATALVALTPQRPAEQPAAEPLPAFVASAALAVQRSAAGAWGEASTGLDPSGWDSERQFIQLAQTPGVVAAAPPNLAAAQPQCQVEAPGAICFGADPDDPDGFGQVLLPPALPEGVVGYWSFDQASARDTSGFGNHGLGQLFAGPSLGGFGGSAYFRRSFLEMPGGGEYSVKDFSYTFWLYMIPEGGHAKPPPGAAGAGPACPVLRKGVDSRSQDFGQRFAAAPAVLYDLASRRLQIELATDTAAGDGGGYAETFRSNSRLKPGKWFHVALVRLDAEKLVRLYVNGVLDSTKRTLGTTRVNNEPLFVGGDPLTKEVCDMPFYLDELKAYSRQVTPDEIQAEAAPALAGVEPHFVRLGCVQCTIEQATQSCPDEYHICNSLEMHMGGYQVARSLGWLEKHTHVWIHEWGGNTYGLPLRSGAGAAGLAPAPSFVGAPTPAPVPAQPPAQLLTPEQAAQLTAPGPAPSPVYAGLGLGLCCADPS